MKLINRLASRDDGAAAVEFAIVAPLLAALLGWIVTGAIEINTQNAVREAVNSGALYVMRGGSDAGQIRDVTLAAWSGAPGALSVEVDQQCKCGEQVASCTQICLDNSTPERFSRVRGSLSGDRPFTSQQIVRTR
ncbi:MAG: pilus assembly protein [Phenylobacterium sp.]|nr:pilus assembly protein [Phenylobacterium sp.]